MPTYLNNLHTYLNSKFPSKKGLWNYSTNNVLNGDWLLYSAVNGLGTSYDNFKQPVAGDYHLFKLSSKDATRPNQQSVAINATVQKPGGTPANLLAGQSYTLYEQIYEVMISAKVFLDITTLTPPTLQFLAAIKNALIYLSNKPENERPVVRILYSNWAANAAGFPDLILDANAFLKDIVTNNIDPAKKFSIYAGAINAGAEKGIVAWASSWNHSKIIAADGQVAIVGGHNMWGDHYLGKNPVFDVSMKVHGDAAVNAHDYADKLWGYLLWRINDSLFDAVMRSDGKVSLAHCAAYTYDENTNRSTIKDCFKFETKPFAGVWVNGLHPYTVTVNPKGQPPKDVYTSRKSSFPINSGSVPVLSIGREAGMDLSNIFPDKDSYLDEVGEPADISMYTLFSYAQNKIRMSLQSFSLVSAIAQANLFGYDLHLDWRVVTWDYKLFYEMAKAVRRGVEIEIVLSNPNAIAGGLTKTEAPYDGEHVQDVNNRLRDVLIKEFVISKTEAEALVASKFHVANFRFSTDDEMYRDENGEKKVPIPNHAKTFMVDDQVFYIGSQNQYRCNLAEFGYVVEDQAAVTTYINNYWNKLWVQSKRTLSNGFDGSLDDVQRAVATVFVLDLYDNKRLEKTWQKAITDYTAANQEEKESLLEILNEIISNAGYETTAAAVIEITRTPFFENLSSAGTPNDDSDRFVKDLLTKKDLTVNFAKLIDSFDNDQSASDAVVNKFLKDNGYNCTSSQLYSSFIGIRGSNINYYKGRYDGVIVQDGGEAFDFRSKANGTSNTRKRSLAADTGDAEESTVGPVLLIETSESIKLDDQALKKAQYDNDVLTWSRADGNQTDGSITFSEIPRPGLKDPFFGVECFGEITYPDDGSGKFNGTVSFYARKQAAAKINPKDPDDPPIGAPVDWPAVVGAILGPTLGLALIVGTGIALKRMYDRFKRRTASNYERLTINESPEEEDIDAVQLVESRVDSALRRRNVSRRLESSNASFTDSWAHSTSQFEIARDVEKIVIREAKTLLEDDLQAQFEKEFSDLVEQSLVEGDFEKSSFEVVSEILGAEFRLQVSDMATAIYRDEIMQEVTSLMTDRMSVNDYKRFAADNMGNYMDSAISKKFSDPLVKRMQTRSSPSEPSYIEALLTREFISLKQEYLKQPGNKTELQRSVSEELSTIDGQQKKTASELESSGKELETARSALDSNPSKENKDRVDELTKEVSDITDRQQKFEQEQRDAEARQRELDESTLDQEHKEMESKTESEGPDIFKHVE